MAHVQVLTGLKLGTRIEIVTDKFTVGRAAGSSLVLTDPSISTKHAVIERLENGQYTLKDLGSTNGTRVNESVIREQSLSAKDILKFGSVEAMFDGDDVVSAPRPTPVHAVLVEELPSEALSTPVSAAFGVKQKNGNPGWWVMILLATLVASGLIWFFVHAFHK